MATSLWEQHRSGTVVADRERYMATVLWAAHSSLHYLAVRVTEACHKQARAKLVHHVHHESGVVAQQTGESGGGGGFEVLTLGGAVDLDQAKCDLIAVRTWGWAMGIQVRVRKGVMTEVCVSPLQSWFSVA